MCVCVRVRRLLCDILRQCLCQCTTGFVRSIGGTNATTGLLYPVIDRDTDKAVSNRNGFEGGKVVHANGRYYVFTAELYGAIWAQNRIALWR